MKRIFQGLLLWVLGGVILAGFLPAPVSCATTDAYFQERANLALREIAHRMLLLTGDSTTRIPPVQMKDGRQFTIRFPGELRYDTLRSIVDQILVAAEMPLRYDLAVYDCLDAKLLVGFAALPRPNADGYPCQERGSLHGCVDIVIRFPRQSNLFTAGSRWLGSLMLFIGLLAALRWRRRGNGVALDMSTRAAGDYEMTESIDLGSSVFYPREQTVINGRIEKKLTYREAKLLQYFSQHPNLVLPREQILAAVWGEEGVLVTRSLDVFVSRLRKILGEDPCVQIASIHGVGYRFVISTSTSIASTEIRLPNRLLDSLRT